MGTPKYKFCSYAGKVCLECKGLVIILHLLLQPPSKSGLCSRELWEEQSEHGWLLLLPHALEFCKPVQFRDPELAKRRGKKFLKLKVWSRNGSISLGESLWLSQILGRTLFGTFTSTSYGKWKTAVSGTRQQTIDHPKALSSTTQLSSTKGHLQAPPGLVHSFAPSSHSLRGAYHLSFSPLPTLNFTSAIPHAFGAQVYNSFDAKVAIQ